MHWGDSAITKHYSLYDFYCTSRVVCMQDFLNNYSLIVKLINNYYNNYIYFSPEIVAMWLLCKINIVERCA